ncbi:MAG: HAD family hydrolase [Bacteroidales bacterium]
MRNSIRTIIWDWNGTLLDDMDICVDSINILLEKRGLPLMNLEKYRSIFTFPVIDYYKTIGFDFDKEPYDSVAIEFISIYLNKLKSASIFQEVRPTLEIFKEKGYQQAILSAMEQENLLISVNSKGIQDYFSCIYGTDDHYAHGKTYLLSRILKCLDVDPKETLLIGDTLHDHEVALSAGCNCLLVAAGHQEKRRLDTAGCQVINNLNEISRLFN